MNRTVDPLLAAWRNLSARPMTSDDGAALWGALTARVQPGSPPLDANASAALRDVASRLAWPAATLHDPAALAAFEPLGVVPLVELCLAGRLRGHPDAIDALRGPGLGVVGWLNLASNKLGPGVVEGVVARPWWSSLRGLELKSNWLGADGARALAAAPPGALRRLSLDDNGLGDDGARALSGAAVLRALTTLAMNLDEVSDEGVSALCDGEALPGLLALDLGGNAITSAGATALARSPRWPSLSSLMLGGNPLGDEGAASLARGFARGAVRELWLDGCQIGDEGATALAEAPWIRAIERLVLRFNPLSPRGIAALRGSLDSPDALVVDA
jgi:hypothetical protein